jgi:hypothetical protein
MRESELDALHERIRAVLGWKDLDEVRKFDLHTLRDLVHMQQHSKLAREITEMIRRGDHITREEG